MRPLDRVLETCLYAPDLEPAAEFYERVLGLPVISRVADRHVFFRVGAGMLLLFQPDATAASRDVPPHGASGPGHLAFAVPFEALPAWRRHFAGHGIEVEKEVRWPNGGMSLYLRDPAGNSVELATPDIWPLEP